MRRVCPWAIVGVVGVVLGTWLLAKLARLRWPKCPGCLNQGRSERLRFIELFSIDGRLVRYFVCSECKWRGLQEGETLRPATRQDWDIIGYTW